MTIKRILSLLLVVFLLPWNCFADTLMLPAGVQIISDSAFEGDTSLDEVVLPDGVKSIGSRAFADSSVGHINLPDSLEYIADDAFEGADNSMFYAEWGTYAFQWMEDHHILLRFTDEYCYDASVDMAIVEADDEIGLYDDPFAYYFELADVESWAENLNGKPSWSVNQIEGSGTSDYYLAENGHYAASLIVEMPEKPCTRRFEVVCEWDGLKSKALITVNHVYPASLPNGATTDDYYVLTPNQDNVISLAFAPADYAFGNADRVGLEDYTGEADWWWEGHDLHIVPHEEGTFEGFVALYAGNMYIGKTVEFRVGNEGHEYSVEDLVNLLDEGVVIDTIPHVELPLLSVDDITDPDMVAEIEEYNHLVAQYYSAVDDFNECLSKLDDCSDQMDISLSCDDGTFNLTMAGESFSAEGTLIEKLAQDYTISEVVEADDGSLQFTMASGDETYSFVQAESSIHTSSDPIEPQGEALVVTPKSGSGSTGAGWGERLEGVADRVERVSSWYNSASDALSYVQIYMSGIGVEIAKHPSMFNEAKIADIMQLNGCIDVLNEGLNRLGIGEKAKAFLEAYYRWRDIQAIRQHGHPTEMEVWYPYSLDIWHMLQNILKIAVVELTSDMLTNGVDVALALRTKDLAKQGEEIIESATKRTILSDFVNRLTSKGFDWAKKKVQDDGIKYWKMAKQYDSELHYDVTGIVKDAKKNNLSNVMVTCEDISVHTDGSGRYSIEVPYDSAVLVFTKDGYIDQTRQIGCTPYEPSILNIVLEQKPMATISGTVVDQFGDPVGGVKVSSGDFSTITNYSDGSYTLTLPAEKRVIRFSCRGYVDVVKKQDVSSGAPIDAVMNWSYGVQGKITDTDGNPIEGASVGILVAGVEKYLKHLTTDENGEYRYHIEPGSYDSRISADDHIAPDYSERTQRDRFEVKEGGITNLSRSLLNVEGKYVMGVTAHVITSTNVANAIPVHATFSWEDVTIERGNHWGFMLVSTTPVVRLTSSYTYTHESVQYTKSNFVKDIDITALKTGNFSLSWYYDHD